MSSTAMTTDGAWELGSSVRRKKPPLIAPGLAGLGRGHDRVAAHLRAEHLRLPAEGSLIEGGHALPVPGRQLEVNHGIHRSSPALDGFRRSRGRYSARVAADGRGAGAQASARGRRRRASSTASSAVWKDSSARYPPSRAGRTRTSAPRAPASASAISLAACSWSGCAPCARLCAGTLPPLLSRARASVT